VRHGGKDEKKHRLAYFREVPGSSTAEAALAKMPLFFPPFEPLLALARPTAPPIPLIGLGPVDSQEPQENRFGACHVQVFKKPPIEKGFVPHKRLLTTAAASARCSAARTYCWQLDHRNSTPLPDTKNLAPNRRKPAEKTL
jgi:hypothetical protein